ncbi:fibronectin type III domain-containing protein [Luteolibacter marinus]|uniref:fibronectin type III domain-containing protein n=1 Tax=Luteolibacter marinus TaxID=2776705 RepID=UPI0018689801|nr:fibronectin type III domain-containing protein [Luteolibacter marinus]
MQQSTAPTFSLADARYEGPDTASVLSGFREGDYHFRVRAITPAGEAGPWSDTLTLRVHFMDRRTLFLLLGTGFTVAALTIGAIVHGFLAHRTGT